MSKMSKRKKHSVKQHSAQSNVNAGYQIKISICTKSNRQSMTGIPAHILSAAISHVFSYRMYRQNPAEISEAVQTNSGADFYVFHLNLMRDSLRSTIKQ